VRIELDQSPSASRLFGCDQSAADPAKRVKHNAMTIRAIPDRIYDERDRLCRRMQRQLAFSRSVEGILARIIPHIGSVTAMTAKFDVVDMRTLAVLEDEDELVLGPVKRTHAAGFRRISDWR